MGAPCNQTSSARGLTHNGNSPMTSAGMRSMAKTEMPLFGVARFRTAQ
jgi:hypothetical protein